MQVHVDLLLISQMLHRHSCFFSVVLCGLGSLQPLGLGVRAFIYSCSFYVQDVVVPIAKPVIEERTTHIPKPVVVEKVIEVPRIVHRPYPVERIVEVPQTKIEYRYRDVPVTRKVARPVVPPLQESHQVVEERTTQPSVVTWRQQSSPIPTVSTGSPPWVVSACCAPPPRRESTQEIHYYTHPNSPRSCPAPARWHTAPIRREVQQPFVVERVETAADEAACCPLTPRQRRGKRGELLLTPRGPVNQRYNVRVATLSPRKVRTRPFEACCDLSPRAASVPPTVRVSSTGPLSLPRSS